MVDQEVIGSQLKRDRFPFQSEGDITLALRNATPGPVMLHIDMKPGAVIPAHFHRGTAEALL
jgi:quercetin dioxygenase-like cupin family protein